MTEDELFGMLREAAKADGRSPAELAREAGVSPPAMSRFMAGGGLSVMGLVGMSLAVKVPIGHQPDCSTSGTPAEVIPQVEQLCSRCNGSLTAQPGTELARIGACPPPPPRPGMPGGPNCQERARSQRDLWKMGFIPKPTG